MPVVGKFPTVPGRGGWISPTFTKIECFDEFTEIGRFGWGPREPEEQTRARPHVHTLAERRTCTTHTRTKRTTTPTMRRGLWTGYVAARGAASASACSSSPQLYSLPTFASLFSRTISLRPQGKWRWRAKGRRSRWRCDGVAILQAYSSSSSTLPVALSGAGAVGAAIALALLREGARAEKVDVLAAVEVVAA